MKKDYRKFDLLSIEGWNSPNGWTWNSWHTLESDIFILESELTPRKIFRFLRKAGYLNDYSKGRIMLEDDGYNLVIMLKSNMQPLLALCYGKYWEYNHL